MLPTWYTVSAVKDCLGGQVSDNYTFYLCESLPPSPYFICLLEIFCSERVWICQKKFPPVMLEKNYKRYIFLLYWRVARLRCCHILNRHSFVCVRASWSWWGKRAQFGGCAKMYVQVIREESGWWARPDCCVRFRKLTCDHTELEF